jgi:hypothetical protein
MTSGDPPVKAGKPLEPLINARFARISKVMTSIPGIMKKA